MESYYLNAQQLVEMKLEILPTTVKGMKLRAEREAWQSRKRTQRGGGIE